MANLNEIADVQLRDEQRALQQIEYQKKHLTQQVCAEELDDVDFIREEPLSGDLLTKEQMKSRNMTMVRDMLIGETFRKNRLSVDPVVLPTSDLENIAKVPIETIQRELTSKFLSLRSPRKSIKN